MTLAGVVAAPVLAETAGQYIDDSTIATKTKTALLEDDTAPGTALNVEVYKGVVQLSGFVGSEAEEAAALAVASKIEGAKQVKDAIVVLPGDRTMGETVDDTTIQTKLKAGLADVEGFGNAFAVNTEVRKGHVILAGFVESEAVRDSAGQVAKGISGVTEVHNYISVQP